MSLAVTRLWAKNFKGRTFTIEFQKPVTIIQGLNSTGKSARMEAMQLALLGYVPGEDKPTKAPRAIFDTYGPGGSDGKVLGHLEVGVDMGGESHVRSWTMSKKSVKYAGPDGPVIPPTAMDPAAFLSAMNGPQKTEFLFDTFVRSSEDLDGLHGELCSGLKQGIPKDAGAKAEESACEIAEEIPQQEEDQTVLEWFGSLRDWVKEQKSTADQNAKRMAEALRAATQVDEESEKIPEDVEQKLKAVDDELVQAKSDRTSADSKLTDARERWKAAKEKAEQVESPEEDYLKDLEKQVDRLAAETKEQVFNPDRIRENQLRTRKEALQKSVTECERGVESAKQQADKAVEAVDTAKDRTCPTCGHELKPLSKKEMDALRAEVKVAQAEHESREEELAKVKEELAACEQELDKELQRNREQSARADAFFTKVGKHQALRRELDTAKEARDAQAELPKLRDQGKQLAEDLEQKIARVNELESKKNDLRQQVNALQKARAKAANQEALKDSEEYARGYATCYKVLAKLVEEKFQKLAYSAVSPMVETMNRLCSPLLPDKVEFRDGDFYMGGHTHRSCSDSEKLLVYAGLCVALAATSPAKLALIGRLESFDFVKQQDLVNLLVQLAGSGAISQALLVGVQASETPVVRESKTVDVIYPD